MEFVIATLNTLGNSFVNFALSMWIQSSVLILALLGLDLLLRKKVRAVIRYGVLMLVLVKLILPPSFTSPTGLGYWLDTELPQVAANTEVIADTTEFTTDTTPALPDLQYTGPDDQLAVMPPQNYDYMPFDPPISDHEYSPMPQEPPQETSAAQPASPPSLPPASTTPLNYQAMLFLVWLAGVIMMVLLLLQRLSFVKGLIKQSDPANEFLNETLAQCSQQMNMRSKVTIKLSPNAASPSVCGLFRPVILMPQGITAKLEISQLRAILLHELAHIKRGDLWFSFVQTVLQIIYFYNPLLWVANAVIRKVREQAVDEMVLVTMGEQAPEYPRMLLDVSKLTFRQPALSLRLIGVIESKSALKTRIKHILTRPFPKTANLGIIGMLGVAIAAMVLLPMAAGKNSDPLPVEPMVVEMNDESTDIESEPEKTKQTLKVAPSSTVSFHVVEYQESLGKYGPSVGKDEVEKKVKALKASGPGEFGAKDFSGWVEVTCDVPKEAAVGQYQDKQFVLVNTFSACMMISKKDAFNDWGLIDVRAVTDESGQGAVEFELGDLGTQKLEGITGIHCSGRYMATAIDGKIINISMVDQAIRGKGKIEGGFTPQEAEDLAAALKRGMPATRELHTRIENPQTSLDRIEELIKLNPELINSPRGWPWVGDYPLLTAIRSKRPEVVKFLLENGASVNVQSKDGQWPLHYAMIWAGKESADILLEHGADINAVDAQGITVLGKAAQVLKPDMVSYMLDKGADVNGRGEGGLSPIAMAAFAKGSIQKADEKTRKEYEGKIARTIKLLLDRGAKIDFFAAVGLGDLERMRAMLKADSTIVNRTVGVGPGVKMTPLYTAVFTGQTEAVRLLLDHGAEIDVKIEHVGSPLELASMYGHLEIVKLLQEYRKKTHKVNGSTNAAFLKACLSDNTSLVKHLLDSGADFNTRGKEGKTALHSAAKMGRTQVIKLLLSRGADVNAKCNEHATPLYDLVEASRYPNIDEKRQQQLLESACMLIEAGADVNADKGGDTPLLKAVAWPYHWNLNIDLVKLLIKSGADVNGKGKLLPLVHAVKANNLELVKVLIEAGADPFVDAGGLYQYKLPVNIADDSQKGKEIAQYLRKQMAPKQAKLDKAVTEAAGLFFKAIRQGSDAELKAMAANHPNMSEKGWVNWARELRTAYKGHAQLLEKYENFRVQPDWAEVVIKSPPEENGKYLAIYFMRFPDNSWRAVTERKVSDENLKSILNQKSIRSSGPVSVCIGLRHALFDAAGMDDEVDIGGRSHAGMPGEGKMVISVKNGHLRFDFPDRQPHRYFAIEVHDKKVKRWDGKELRVCRAIELGRNGLKLTVENGKATLSNTGKEITLQAVEDKVIIKHDGNIVKAKEITFHLPKLDYETKVSGATKLKGSDPTKTSGQEVNGVRARLWSVGPYVLYNNKSNIRLDINNNSSQKMGFLFPKLVRNEKTSSWPGIGKVEIIDSEGNPVEPGFNYSEKRLHPVNAGSYYTGHANLDMYGFDFPKPGTYKVRLTLGMQPLENGKTFKITTNWLEFNAVLTDHTPGTPYTAEEAFEEARAYTQILLSSGEISRDQAIDKFLSVTEEYPDSSYAMKSYFWAANISTQYGVSNHTKEEQEKYREKGKGLLANHCEQMA